MLNVGGDEFVAAECHGEGTATGGEGAQGGAVAVHLGERSLGAKGGVFAFGIHAHNDGTTALEVGHDATLGLGGNGDGDVVDGFLNLRTSEFEGFAEGSTACDFESGFVGVDGVHFTVVDVDDDVAGVGTGEGTLLHFLHDTFEDGGHEAGVDGTADDAVVEDEFAAPVEGVFLSVADGVFSLVGHAVVVGLDEHVDFAKLTGTAGLFLVTVHGFGALGDGLAVGDVGSGEVDSEFVLVFEVPFDGVEVEFALAAEDYLAEFAAVFEGEAAVVGAEVFEGGTDFFVVVIVGGFDSNGIDGGGEFDFGDGVVGVFGRGEGVVDFYVFEFDGADDVAGAGFFDALTVFAAADEYLADAFFALVAGVDDVLGFGEFAVVDAEIGDFTEVFIFGALESEGDGGVGGVAFEFFAGFGLFGVGNFAGSRDVLADEFKETVYTEVFFCGGAKDGEEVAFVDGELEGFGEFFGGEVTVFEVFFHEFVVGSSGFFDESHAHFFSFVGEFGGDVGLGVFAVGEGVHFVGNDVNYLVESQTGVGGELEDGALGAEEVFELVDAVVEIGFFGVEVVDDEEHGGVEFCGVAVGDFGADFDTALGVDHDNGSFDYVESGVEFALVVGEAGDIEDVDFLATEFGVHEGGFDAVFAVEFDVAIVADGVFVVYTATTVDEAAAEGHGFGHGGFARFGTADEGDVADVGCLVYFHVVIVLLFCYSLIYDEFCSFC